MSCSTTPWSMSPAIRPSWWRDAARLPGPGLAAVGVRRRDRPTAPSTENGGRLVRGAPKRGALRVAAHRCPACASRPRRGWRRDRRSVRLADRRTRRGLSPWPGARTSGRDGAHAMPGRLGSLCGALARSPARAAGCVSRSQRPDRLCGLGVRGRRACGRLRAHPCAAVAAATPRLPQLGPDRRLPRGAGRRHDGIAVRRCRGRDARRAVAARRGRGRAPGLEPCGFRDQPTLRSRGGGGPGGLARGGVCRRAAERP